MLTDAIQCKLYILQHKTRTDALKIIRTAVSLHLGCPATYSDVAKALRRAANEQNTTMPHLIHKALRDYDDKYCSTF